MASVKFIRDRARTILGEFHIERPPVPIRALIEGFALTIEEVWREDSYDGELIPELRVIRINRRKPSTRQRFTMAHELGHWVLFHQQRLFEGDEDPGPQEDTQRLSREDSLEDNGSRTPLERALESVAPRQNRDREANQFAAEILMPAQWVRNDWNAFRSGIDLLAKRYEVSDDAMWVRVLELRLIK